MEVVVPRPVTMSLQFLGIDDSQKVDRLFVNTGRTSKKPHMEWLTRIHSHPSPVAKRLAHLKDRWSFANPKDGLRLAAFDPSGIVCFTLELEGREDPSKVIDIPSSGTHDLKINWSEELATWSKQQSRKPIVSLRLTDDAGPVIKLENRVRIEFLDTEGEWIEHRIIKGESPGAWSFQFDTLAQGTLKVSSNARGGGYLGRRIRGVYAEISFNALSEHARIDVGEVKIPSLPLIAKGQVLDHKGQPIAGVVLASKTKARRSARFSLGACATEELPESQQRFRTCLWVDIVSQEGDIDGNHVPRIRTRPVLVVPRVAA
ncbi:MAG: hypothetical protein V3W41_13720 [Planctomycetota bacterium]